MIMFMPRHIDYSYYKTLYQLLHTIIAARSKKMNVLILSVGTRNKVVQYFTKEVGNAGKIVVTDCSVLAPAVYEADQFYKVPRIDSPEYIDAILEICNKEKIDTLFALIDPELSINFYLVMVLRRQKLI